MWPAGMRLCSHRWIFLSLTAGLAAFGGEANALIFGEDKRVSVKNGAGSPFAPVGIVFGTAEASYATAFLIDDCHALTVQHVFGEQASATGRRIMFAANVNGPRANWSTTWAVVKADGGLEQSVRRSHGNDVRASDWAILRLSKCLGKAYGHVRLSARANSNQPIAIAGYPGDRPLSSGVTIDANCQMRAVRGNLLLHDCAALPGNSGGPLFRIIEQDGVPILEVIALAEAAHSTIGLGFDSLARRDNYPDAVWNVATLICDNPALAAQPELNCNTGPARLRR